MDVDRHHGKFSSACARVEFVDIDFNSPYAANVFDYEALNDPVIKQAFGAVIRSRARRRARRRIPSSTMTSRPSSPS
ncbi:hypothetical protein ACEUDJ_02200 [Aeromonas bivalvium]|uniref:Virulence factor Evf domain-containing protein n=1 Tax=Aeromonas bivalvium TaxID=440079 RepID=A0ABW9GNZ9_9GAMM